MNITDELWQLHCATFEKRGVLRSVAERRPYIRYEAGERTITDELFTSIPPRSRGATITRRLNYRDPETGGGGGWIMVRHAVNDTPILPEFGPADALEPHTRTHDHTWPPRWVNHIRGRGHDGKNTDGMHEHDWIEKKHRHDSVDPSAWKKHTDGKRSGHHGKPPVTGVHPHDKTKKYLFAPKPWAFRPYMKVEHSHGAKSLKKWHPEGATSAEHQHIEYAKVAESFARRLDVHPDTKFPTKARRVFFLIEGVLKNDSLVSAGEIAFNVPSVWQTDAPELEPFARSFLQGKMVYIVPDSDWAENPEVALAAFTSQATLGRILGSPRVKVAAPTAEPAHCEQHDAEAGEKRGIDDYLADVGSVAGLEVVSRTTSPRMYAWCKQYRVTSRGGTYANGRKRNAEVLMALALLADDQGRVSRRERSIARFLGWTNPYAHERVRDAINALLDVDGPDFLQKDPDALDFEFSSGPFGPGTAVSLDTGGIVTNYRGEWTEAPVLVIRQDLRAVRESTSLEN